VRRILLDQWRDFERRGRRQVPKPTSAR
jgi:hypothetical protein